MSAKLLQELEEWKQQVIESATADDFEVRLDELNVRFQSVIEDFRLLTPEEQEFQRGNYFQVQYMYHNMLMIDRLMNPLTEQEVPPSGQVPPNAGMEQNEAKEHDKGAVNEQDKGAVDEQEEGAVGGKANERPQPVDVQPGYLDFCKILDPIFSLEPIHEINEQSIRCL